MVGPAASRVTWILILTSFPSSASRPCPPISSGKNTAYAAKPVCRWTPNEMLERFPENAEALQRLLQLDRPTASTAMFRPQSAEPLKRLQPGERIDEFQLLTKLGAGFIRGRLPCPANLHGAVGGSQSVSTDQLRAPDAGSIRPRLHCPCFRSSRSAGTGPCGYCICSICRAVHWKN